MDETALLTFNDWGEFKQSVVRSKIARFPHTTYVTEVDTEVLAMLRSVHSPLLRIQHPPSEW